MEDPDADWEMQALNSYSKERGGRVSWILNKGLWLGKKVIITGVVISSAPLVLPPLVVFTTLGFACSVPFGLVFASYACTEKLMSTLLPDPASSFMLEHGTNLSDESQEVVEEDLADVNEQGELGYKRELVKKQEEEEQAADTVDGVMMRIELDAKTSDEFQGDGLHQPTMYEQNGVVMHFPKAVDYNQNMNQEGKIAGEEEQMDYIGEVARPEVDENCKQGDQRRVKLNERVKFGLEAGLLQEDVDHRLTGIEEGEKKSMEVVTDGVEKGRHEEEVDMGEYIEGYAELKPETDGKREVQVLEDNRHKSSSRHSNVKVNENNLGGVSEAVLEEQKAVLPEEVVSSVPSECLAMQKKTLIHLNSDLREIADESGLDLLDGGTAYECSYTAFVSTGGSLVADRGSSEFPKSEGEPELNYTEPISPTDPATHFNEELLGEDKVWEKIDALRAIVGYKAARQLKTVEELKSLYNFTGVDLPVLNEDGSDLMEVNKKLRFLMSVIGVK